MGRPTTRVKEPHIICPVTGFSTPISECVFQFGVWVSKDGFDELGYKQVDKSVVVPHAFHMTRRRRPKPNPQTGTPVTP